MDVRPTRGVFQEFAKKRRQFERVAVQCVRWQCSCAPPSRPPPRSLSSRVLLARVTARSHVRLRTPLSPSPLFSLFSKEGCECLLSHHVRHVHLHPAPPHRSLSSPLRVLLLQFGYMFGMCTSLLPSPDSLS